MLQAVPRNVVMVIIVFTVAVWGVIILSVIQPISAQELSQSHNMRELLETLNAQIEGATPIQITFRFEHPLMDNEELFWEIPYRSPDGEVSRWIGEIGNDFVCFYEQAGSTGVARCTPFSNIVSVSYLGNP